MKNVLLIGSKNKNIRSGQYLAPPLGVHRIASYLRKNDINVDVVDPNLGLSELMVRLRSKKYDVIGHSILHPTLKNDIDIISLVRKEQPLALLVAGGQGAAFNQEMILRRTPINIVVRGFGEFQMLDIVMGKEKNDIEGIFFKRNQKIVCTGPAKEMTSKQFRMISLGLDFSQIPYERYWEVMSKRYSERHLRLMKNEGMLRTIRLVTSNYCPMGCTFCSSTKFLNDAVCKKQRLLQLSPAEIRLMMRKAVKAHPSTEAFYFNDDNFLADRERVMKFCSLCSDQKYNFMCAGRVDNVDREMLCAMRKAGFRTIFYGVETFSSRLAKKIRKTTTTNYRKVAKRAILETLKAGITPQISLILFMPSASKSDISRTIEITLHLINKGARVTVFPYVEAYSGTDIINRHELEYSDLRNGVCIPNIVLPDNIFLRTLASESVEMKTLINEKMKCVFGDVIPQPIDALSLFMSVYSNMGRPTEKIEEMIKSMSKAGH